MCLGFGQGFVFDLICNGWIIPVQTFVVHLPNARTALAWQEKQCSGFSAVLACSFFLTQCPGPCGPAEFKDQLNETLMISFNVKWTFSQAISSHKSPFSIYEGLFLEKGELIRIPLREGGHRGQVTERVLEFCYFSLSSFIFHWSCPWAHSPDAILAQAVQLEHRVADQRICSKLFLPPSTP